MRVRRRVPHLQVDPQRFRCVDRWSWIYERSCLHVDHVFWMGCSGFSLCKWWSESIQLTRLIQTSKTTLCWCRSAFGRRGVTLEGIRLSVIHVSYNQMMFMFSWKSSFVIKVVFLALLTCWVSMDWTARSIMIFHREKVSHWCSC